MHAAETRLKPVHIPNPASCFWLKTGLGGLDARRGHPGTLAGVRN